MICVPVERDDGATATATAPYVCATTTVGPGPAYVAILARAARVDAMSNFPLFPENPCTDKDPARQRCGVQGWPIHLWPIA